MAKIKAGKEGLFEIDIPDHLTSHPLIQSPAVMGTRPHAIMTGDAPQGPKIPATVGSDNDALIEDLKRMSYEYEPVKGFYTQEDPERSQIIYDIPPKEALKLALRHGQNSIVYHDGNVPKLMWAHASTSGGENRTGWVTPVPTTGSKVASPDAKGDLPKGEGYTILNPTANKADQIALHYDLDFDATNATAKEFDISPQELESWTPGSGGQMTTPAQPAAKTPDVAAATGVDMSKSEFTAVEAATILRKHVEDLLVKSGKVEKCYKCGTMMTKASACNKCGEMSVGKAAELSKVSPPGHEKQVEHIAEQYEKKGKSAGQAKAIATATAWKEHNAPGHTHKKSELELIIEELEKAEKCPKCGEMTKGESCAKCGDMKVAKAEEYELHADAMHVTPSESGGHGGRRVTIVALPSEKHPEHYKVKPAQGGFPFMAHKKDLRSVDGGTIKKAEELLVQLEAEAADLIKMITPGTVDAVIAAPSHARALASKPSMSPQHAAQRAAKVVGLASKVSGLLSAAKAKLGKAEEKSPKAPEYPAAKQKRAVSVMDTGENSSPIPEKTEEVSAPGSGGEIVKGKKIAKAELLGEVASLLKAMAGVPSAKPPKASKGAPAGGGTPPAPKAPAMPKTTTAGMGRIGKADEEESSEESSEGSASKIDKSLFGVR